MPFQTPVVIVPILARLDSVSIAVSIVASVVASKASILERVIVPPLSARMAVPLT